MPCVAIRHRLAKAIGAALLATLFVLALRVPLAHAETIRLEDLEATALSRRSSLSAARARVSAARSSVEAARAPGRPTLRGEVTGQAAPGGRLVRVADTAGDEYLVSGSRTFGEEGALIPDLRYGAGLSLTGPLYDFGRTNEAERAARAELGATNLDERAERRAILREVETAYLDWLSAFATRNVVLRRAASTRMLRESAEDRAAEGAVAGAETEPARYDEVRAALDLERAETELIVSRLVLERATARTLPENAEPDWSILDAMPPRANLHENDPEPEALRQRAHAMAARAAAHRASSRPILAGVVELGVRGQTTNVFPLYRVGVSLAIPVVGGEIESAAADVAASRADELRARAQEARAQATLERERVRQRLARAEQELGFARRLVELATLALEREQERLALGSGSHRAVAQARLELAQAELELLSVRVARVRAILVLTDGSGRTKRHVPHSD